jgi:NitT/TauT family transport system substrate-binding protein
MLKRRLMLAVGLALTCLTLPSLVQAAELTKASLRLKWLPQTQFAGFYVAQAKGYYKDEGIDLTINPGGPNLLTENLVASGTDTFGLSGGTDSVFAARAKNLPIICIGVAHQLTPFVFVSKKDGPVKTLEDFRGRNVTTWFTGSNYVLFGMLADKNIAQKEVKIQPQQVSVTPFVNGDVDVVTATWYNELDTLKTRMGAENLRLFVAEDYGITFPRDTLITSETVAKENPELVKAFLRATLRGWKDAVNDPKNAVDTVMKVAPTLERAHQEAMLTEATRLMEAGSAKDNGLLTIDMVAVQKAHDFLLKYNVIPEAVDLKAAFQPQFLESIPAADRKL